MNVPVNPSAGFKCGVVPRKEPRADAWGEEEYGMVGYEGDNYFMNM